MKGTVVMEVDHGHNMKGTVVIEGSLWVRSGLVKMSRYFVLRANGTIEWNKTSPPASPELARTTTTASKEPTARAKSSTVTGAVQKGACVIHLTTQEGAFDLIASSSDEARHWVRKMQEVSSSAPTSILIPETQRPIFIMPLQSSKAALDSSGHSPDDQYIISGAPIDSGPDGLSPDQLRLILAECIAMYPDVSEIVTRERKKASRRLHSTLADMPTPKDSPVDVVADLPEPVQSLTTALDHLRMEMERSGMERSTKYGPSISLKGFPHDVSQGADASHTDSPPSSLTQRQDIEQEEYMEGENPALSGRNRNFSLQRVGQLEHWLIPFEELDIGERIGEGAFCDIHICHWRSSIIVVKKLKSKKMIKELMTEIELMREIRHPNIAQFLGATLDPHAHAMMLIEFVDGMTIFDWVTKTRRIPSKRRLEVMADMAMALTFLHSCNPPIVYRDLKPDNCMVDKHGKCKLLDFGLSKKLAFKEDGEVHRMTGKTGTQRFMSPEVSENRKYGLSTDVYSFGLLLFFVTCGELPFAGPNARERLKRFHGGEHAVLNSKGLISNISVRSLVDRCTQRDPEARPTMKEAHAELRTMASKRKSVF